MSLCASVYFYNLLFPAICYVHQLQSNTCRLQISHNRIVCGSILYLGMATLLVVFYLVFSYLLSTFYMYLRFLLSLSLYPVNTHMNARTFSFLKLRSELHVVHSILRIAFFLECMLALP